MFTIIAEKEGDIIQAIKKLLIWKNTKASIKKKKQCLAFCSIISTALCILAAPSGPLRAIPGPNIVEKVAIVTAKSPEP
jgi:hypothetical protein